MSLMYSLHRSRALSPHVRSRPAETLRPSLAPLSATAPPALWTRVACRGSQVPGKSLPRLCHALRFRPVRPTSPYRSARCCPRNSENEDTRDTYFGTQSRGFGICCLRFKWCVTAPACKTSFRLAVSLYREGVEPSGLQRKVSIRYIGRSPFPDLSWRDGKSGAGPSRVDFKLASVIAHCVLDAMDCLGASTTLRSQR